jgi:hypothetical protein
VDGPVRTAEEEQPGGAADTGGTEREAIEGNAGGEPAYEGASDVDSSATSVRSVVRFLIGSSDEESEEEEIVEAQEQIDRVTEHIALGNAGGRTETMEDIMQLEQCIVVVGSMRYDEDSAVEIY